MMDLVKFGGTAYLVVMDGTPHVVIAKDIHAAIRTAFEWWRSDPDCADDEDKDIPLDRVEPLTDGGAIIVEDDVVVAAAVEMRRAIEALVS
jgi:hypothetical protein